ncbi:helix-turn-helix domain-containing protein [Granulicella sp. S190]|uniref:winged helix-turn-helix transcriptional regulator n=1 Tax=Granulicella sp. S190 TaxID=1747226 RepID=UPI00131E62A0
MDIAYTKRVSIVAELLQGKWTVEILCAMRERPVRLSELRREIPLASKKALTARLRFLEASQIILRRDLSGSVLHVEYTLTDSIREPLISLLDELAEWGASHLAANFLQATSPASDARLESALNSSFTIAHEVSKEGRTRR